MNAAYKNSLKDRLATAPTVLQTHGLTKVYGAKPAVHALSLSVRQGEIYGFLGQNGAGKTTTIRMILALVKPTAGWAEALRARVSPSRPEMFERIENMIETPGFYSNP